MTCMARWRNLNLLKCFVFVVSSLFSNSFGSTSSILMMSSREYRSFVKIPLANASNSGKVHCKRFCNAANRSNSCHGSLALFAKMRHARRHSMTRWLKSDVAALFAFVRLFAMTKYEFGGRRVGVALNGSHSINCAQPFTAKNAIAWSMPPPCVPMYRSHFAAMSAKFVLSNENWKCKEETELNFVRVVESVRRFNTTYIVYVARRQCCCTNQSTWTG